MHAQFCKDGVHDNEYVFSFVLLELNVLLNMCLVCMVSFLFL